MIALLVAGVLLAGGDPAPATLAGSSWQVEQIDGQAVLDKNKTVLRFDSAGRVAGRTGCNSFQGAVELDGSALKFPPLALTKMMCPAETMDQERRFVAALGEVRSWTMDGSALLLRDTEGKTRMRLAPGAP